MTQTSPKQHHDEIDTEVEIDRFEDEFTTAMDVPASRARPPVEPMSDDEMLSIAYADADGWRCFYPLARGHLTAAEARAVMRAERGLPAETAEEAAAAEFLLAVGQEWNS